MYVCVCFFAWITFIVLNYVAIVEMYGFFIFLHVNLIVVTQSNQHHARWGGMLLIFFSFSTYIYLISDFVYVCVCVHSDYAFTLMIRKRKRKKNARTHILSDRKLPNFPISSFVFMIVFALNILPVVYRYTLERFACKLVSICIPVHAPKKKNFLFFRLLFRGNEDYVCKRVVN